LLRVAHTAQLSRTDRQAVRDLLHDAFAGDVTDDDVEHAFGGMHALVWEGDALIAHASVVMRRLLHGGRALRTGYVEAVAVRPDRQRRGHGAAVMAEVEAVIRAAYEVGALGSSDEAIDFYLSRGWSRWTGTTSVLTPAGKQRTPDEDGSVLVLQVSAPLNPAGDLACDWRAGDVW
jgi:aminoglycoside 2'-N-acetyltransferase I